MNFWEEEKLTALAWNVDGPVPGGNLMVPPKVRRLSASNLVLVRVCCPGRFSLVHVIGSLLGFQRSVGESELTPKTR